MMAEQKITKKTFKSPFTNPLKQKDNEERKTLNGTTENNSHFQDEGKIKKAGTLLHDKKKLANTAEKTTKKDNAGVKKRPMTSLTDDQYEDIFTSAINRVLTEKFPSLEESGSDEEIEDKAAVPEPNKAQSPHEGAKEPKETGIPVKSSKKQNFKRHATSIEMTSIKKQDSVPKKKCPVLKRTMPFLPMQKKTQEASINTKQIKSKTNYEAEQSEQIVSSSQTLSSQHSHSCKKHSIAKQNNQSQEGRHSQQNSQSQCSQLPFSQPDPHLTLKERLFWLQQRRDVGLWVQCSRPICNKWRYLKDVCDPVDVPHEWFCHMNSDKKYNSCSAPEKPPTAIQEEDLIHNLYTAGSIVWGRLDGYPWWPAMVDDCPDTEQYYWLNGFSDIPTHYNVVFFDEKEVTRAWLTPSKIKPFHGTETSREFRKTIANSIDYGKRIQIAKQQAMEALPMTISERLRIFSFISRHKGPFGTLKCKAVHSKKRKRKESEEEVFGHEKHKETNQVAQKSRKRTVISAATYNGNKSDSSYSEAEKYPETEMSKLSDTNKSPKMLHFSNSSLYTQEIDNQEIRSKGANHKSKTNQTLEYRELSSSDEEMCFNQQLDEISSSQDLFQSEEEGEKGDENEGSKGVNENCNTSLIVRHESNENIKTIQVETSSSLIKVSSTGTENDSVRAVIGRSKLESSKEEMDDHQLPSTSSVTIMDGTMEDDSTRVIVGRSKHEIHKKREESDSLPMTSSLVNILEGERNKQDEIVIVQEPGSSVAPTNETAFIETEEKDTAPPLLPEINNTNPNNNNSFTPPEKKTQDAISNEKGITQDTSNGYSHSEETEAIQDAKGNSLVCTEQSCNMNSNVRDVEAQPIFANGNRADSSNSYIESSSSKSAETFPTAHNENLNSEQGQSTDNTMSTIFHIDSGNIQGGQISRNVSNVTEQTSSSAGMPVVPNSQNNRIQSIRSQNSDAVVPQLSVDEDSDDFEVEE